MKRKKILKKKTWVQENSLKRDKIKEIEKVKRRYSEENFEEYFSSVKLKLEVKKKWKWKWNWVLEKNAVKKKKRNYQKHQGTKEFFGERYDKRRRKSENQIFGQWFCRMLFLCGTKMASEKKKERKWKWKWKWN